MYLINTRTNEKILLAKYYPQDGWLIYCSFTEIINNFFRLSRRQEPDPTFGDCHFQLKYETVVEDEFSKLAKAEEI